MEFGALRYLMKPVRGEELVRLVAHASQVHRLAKLRRQAVAALGIDASEASDLAGLEAIFERSIRSLRMAWQPVFQHSTGAWYGYEALAQSSEPSMETPASLFRAAERIGRLPELCAEIHERVAKSMGQLGEAECLFVNVRPRELKSVDCHFGETVLSRHAGRVVLETSERSPVESVRNIERRVGELRRRGYRVALDDMGAGFSGLTSFVKLSPELVKVDMGLVRGIDHDPAKQKVVRSLHDHCQEMEILVIVEGVETGGELRTLLEIGVDLLRGNFIGASQPPDMAEKHQPLGS